MKSFREYVHEAAEHLTQPAPGDVIFFTINEEVEIAAEVTESRSSSITVTLDEMSLNILDGLRLVTEAEYQGRKVQLGKPMKGDVKKFKVYVKNPKTGNVKKVNFGDPNMEIKRDDPARRKSFRARHGCGTNRASDRTKAAYWSCRMWSSKPVSKIVKELDQNGR